MTQRANIRKLLIAAEALRAELSQNRAAIQRRLRKCGQPDSLQHVTGRCALQQASLTTEAMITELQILSKKQQQPMQAHPLDTPTVEITASPARRQHAHVRIAC